MLFYTTTEITRMVFPYLAPSVTLAFIIYARVVAGPAREAFRRGADSALWRAFRKIEVAAHAALLVLNACVVYALHTASN